MNPCPLCHDGDRRPDTTTITLTRGDVTIVIRQVPAQVCETCGEASLDVETACELEQVAEQAIASGVRYEVRDYVQKAVA
jgi:YgiT-type zinc finger domain-containing protein